MFRRGAVWTRVVRNAQSRKKIVEVKTVDVEVVEVEREKEKLPQRQKHTQEELEDFQDALDQVELLRAIETATQSGLTIITDRL